MVSRNVIINAPHGLHLRPAGSLAEFALKFQCKILLVYQDKEVSAKSLLGVLSLCIRRGMQMTVVCDGFEEEKALDAVVDFLGKL